MEKFKYLTNNKKYSYSKENLNESGIYKIVNIKNNKFYIGSAKEFNKRWRRHIKDLRKNKHHSIYLQRAFNKYGESSFIIEILELCKLEELETKENYYLKTLRPDYNICLSAYTTIGRLLTEEHKEKLRIIGKNNIVAKETLTKYAEEKRKQITMLSYYELTPLIIFESISEACIYVGKNNTYCSTISKCCEGKRKSAFKFKWRYTTKEDIEMFENENITNG